MLNGYGNFKKVYVMVSDILIKEQNDTSNPAPQQLSNGWKKRNRWKVFNTYIYDLGLNY